MKTYIGIKQVEAEKMGLDSFQRSEGKDRILPDAEGFRVTYPDNYVSWSPRKAFEDSYRKSGEFDFGMTLHQLKRGKKMAREGWNGKGMFIYLVPANEYPADGNKLGTMKGVFENDMVPYGAYIAMKTAQNNVVPWLCSQTDMLAEDWQIAE